MSRFTDRLRNPFANGKEGPPVLDSDEAVHLGGPDALPTETVVRPGEPVLDPANSVDGTEEPVESPMADQSPSTPAGAASTIGAADGDDDADDAVGVDEEMGGDPDAMPDAPHPGQPGDGPGTLPGPASAHADLDDVAAPSAPIGVPVPDSPGAGLAGRLDVLNEVLRGQAEQLEKLSDRTARARVVPVVRILADLHGLLIADAVSASPEVADDLEYYRGLVEDALDALGIVARTAEPGDPVDSRRHRVLRVIDVDDPRLDRTIADGPVRHSYEFDGDEPPAVVVKAKITAHRVRRNASPTDIESLPTDKD